MKVRSGFVLIVACALVACNGWPHPRELKEATNHPEKYPTYRPTAAEKNQAFAFQNHRFVVTPAVVDLHAAKLQQVGTSAGMAIYAPRGETAPFTRLYASAGGTLYHEVVPID